MENLIARIQNAIELTYNKQPENPESTVWYDCTSLRSYTSENLDFKLRIPVQRISVPRKWTEVKLSLNLQSACMCISLEMNFLVPWPHQIRSLDVCKVQLEHWLCLFFSLFTQTCRHYLEMIWTLGTEMCSGGTNQVKVLRTVDHHRKYYSNLTLE